MKLCFEHVVVQILLTLLHACGILVLINLTDIPDCFKYILFVMWTLITVSKQSCSQVYLSSCHTLGLLTSLVWTNLFNTSSRYTTSSWYYPMIGQLWQLTSTLTSLRAQTNKHAEYVKPSDTAPFDGLTFDILTRETVFYHGWIVVFEMMLTGCPLLSSRRFSLVRYFITARSIFPLACTDREPGTGYFQERNIFDRVAVLSVLAEQTGKIGLDIPYTINPF